MMENLMLGLISCIGFGYMFNCPKDGIIKGSIAGAFGWMIYQYCMAYHFGAVISTFIAAGILSVICEICARVYKNAVTVFVLPAILPLVPGAGLYYTMSYYIQGNNMLAQAKAIETLKCALAIALALLIVSSMIRLICKTIKSNKRI